MYVVLITNENCHTEEEETFKAIFTNNVACITNGRESFK